MKTESYIIKNNLPDGSITPTGVFKRRNAVQHFINLINYLTINDYKIKTFLRNERNKPLRGTIRVEVDGFYYYVELIAQ